MRDAKELFGKIAQTNHYQVNFSELNTTITEHIRTRFGVTDVRSFVSRKSGILCSEAVLPTSGYATAEVKGDFMGVPQSLILEKHFEIDKLILSYNLSQI